MPFSKKNSTNTFPLQVSLPLSPIRKEEEKSLHRIKIAVTRSIPISDSRQKSFHICNSCFWCATYHMINNHTPMIGVPSILKAPVCNKKQIESIPIFCKLTNMNTVQRQISIIKRNRFGHIFISVK